MNIRDTLEDLSLSAERTGNPRAMWGVYAVSRYVLTDRASTAFCAALRRANPDSLVRRLLASGNASDDALVACCAVYLRRHCKLKGE